MIKCTPKEIIKEIPDTQSVVLPEQWFDNLSDNKSVFSSLYDWMIETARVPTDDKNSLHSRTYVGEKVCKKLLNAEKKRIKKRYKLQGKELDQALFWSDMNSGPMEEIGGCKISGDVILVIPESSSSILFKFSFKLFNRQHEAQVNSVRSKAAGATFFQWLLPQLERPDRVGDIARDAEADKDFPKRSNNYGEIESYLYSAGACAAAIESLKIGWLEYLQQYPNRIVPEAWCDVCGKKIEPQTSLLAWSLESDDLSVLDLGCLEKHWHFGEFESCPLLKVTNDFIDELVEHEKLSEYDAKDLLERLMLWGIIPVATEGHVYFIKSEKTNSVKIGFTSGKVEERIKALQTAHPYKLKLLATIPGTFESERAFHKQFANFRLKGEWFEPHPELLALISIIQNK